MRSFSDEPVHLTLEANGEGDVTAGDIRTTDLVEVVNPDQHLATLDSARSRFVVEIVVEKGVGYHDVADQREESPIGRIPVDGIFSPIEHVNFRVEPRRVGQMTNFDELILEDVDGWHDPSE